MEVSHPHPHTQRLMAHPDDVDAVATFLAGGIRQRRTGVGWRTLADLPAPAAEATATSDLNGKRVLVLCQGGGTSGLLANALAKAAKERGIDLETAADAYGNHVDMLPDFDLVVLAPQAASYLADLQKDCERVGNKCVACRGKQYIELSQNGDKSLAFVSEQLSK